MNAAIVIIIIVIGVFVIAFRTADVIRKENGNHTYPSRKNRNRRNMD